MRGLKHRIHAPFPAGSVVASFTDAWIETLHNRTTQNPPLVASFTDAWIETDVYKMVKFENGVASFTDAWIETKMHQSDNQRPSRIFYRCVD